MRRFFGATIGILTLLILASAGANHGAWSQTSGTIRIVLGVPPGGSIDFLARLLADQISNATGQTMIVESKPGAGGIIAAEAVARAAPDGNTLLINNNGTLISAILRKVNYDPLESFEPICYLVTTPQIIVVNAASPYRTLAELLDTARAKPGELSIASVGPNTTQHIGIERLKRLAHADLTYVPYPGDPARSTRYSAITSTLRFSISRRSASRSTQGTPALWQLWRRGTLNPCPTCRRLPTLAFQASRPTSGSVSSRRPRRRRNVTAQLIDWFRAAVAVPQIKAKLVDLALYPNPKCGADFDAHLRRQAASFTQLIHDLDFKAE